jgi:hypothetical protein
MKFRSSLSIFVGSALQKLETKGNFWTLPQKENLQETREGESSIVDHPPTRRCSMSLKTHISIKMGLTNQPAELILEQLQYLPIEDVLSV